MQWRSRMYKVGKLGLEHAKCGGLYRYKPLSFHAFEYQFRLIYILAFDINVYIRQPAASLATEPQKSQASLILLMMTLTYSATIVIRLTPNKSSVDLIFLL